MGKDIFLGKVVPGSLQEAELKALAAKLPAAARKEAKFTALAGKLSARQIEALGYYIAVRHRLPSVAQEAFDAGAALFEDHYEKAAQGTGAARSQERRLKELQSKLPAAAKGTVSLPKLAGKITDQQLADLEFYIAVKHGLRTIDPEFYDAGKLVFEGKPGSDDETGGDDEAKRLAALEAKLPKSAQESIDLPSFAGRLTPQQMAALEYYIAVRFKVQ
jgi:hypothetical protein